MIIVAISASRRVASCAVQLADGTLVTAEDKNARGAQLPALVAETFERQGLQPSELGAIRVDLGPGSYTGLRVAVTLARFASRFGTASIETTTSYELATAVHQRESANPAKTHRVVFDARRERVHVGEVTLEESQLRVPATPDAAPIESFRETLATGQHLLGDASLKPWLQAACEAAGAVLHPFPDTGRPTSSTRWCSAASASPSSSSRST